MMGGLAAEKTLGQDSRGSGTVPESGFGKQSHESKVSLHSCKQAALRDSSQQATLSLCSEQPSKDEQSRKHE